MPRGPIRHAEPDAAASEVGGSRASPPLASLEAGLAPLAVVARPWVGRLDEPMTRERL